MITKCFIYLFLLLLSLCRPHASVLELGSERNMHINKTRTGHENIDLSVGIGDKSSENNQQADTQDFEFYLGTEDFKKEYTMKGKGNITVNGKEKKKGRGEYESLSVKSSSFRIKGSYDKYGRRKIKKSKFKKGGKKKAYSKRFLNKYFDISGKIFEARNHLGTGSGESHNKNINGNVQSEEEMSHQQGIAPTESRSRHRERQTESRKSGHSSDNWTGEASISTS